MAPTHQLERLADIAGAMRLARELIAHDTWTTEQLQALQRRRLAELVRHATASSPFYRERYAGLDLGDPVELRRLPVVDKATVMERFDDLVCDRRLSLAAVEAHLDGLARDELLLGRYRAMSTGGSTGRKGVFVADRAEWRQYLAGFFRWNHYVGLRPRLPRRLRIASVAAARPLHMTYRMAASIDVGLYRVLRLEAAMPPAAMVEALNRHQPEFLYAYGSVLGLLAAEQLDGRLRISPTVIASSGETHTDELRHAIWAAWGTSSFEMYGLTEAGIIGSHCDRHTGVHLFEDQAIVEVVDERDRPVPAGQLGHKLLVTNLVNRTQPLIRYEVSDMVAVAAEPCPCGRPFRLLRGIEGRNDDILHLPAAAGGTVAVHPLALRGALAGIPGLAQYKVVHDHDGLHVRAALRPGAVGEDAVRMITTRLTGNLAAQGVAGPAVRVELRDSLQDERDTAGKFKLVESRVGRPAPPDAEVAPGHTPPYHRAVAVHELSRADARRIAVRAQLLDSRRPTGLLEVVRHLTLLQLDPTAAIAPNADLVAWSRLGPSYSPADLDTALADRALLELRAMIRPSGDLALYRADMAGWERAERGQQPGWRASQRDWVRANDACRRDILDRLGASGPLPSRELPDTCEVPWRSSGWTNNRNVTQLLELMVLRGEVAIAGRRGGDRLWDLATRVYPDDPVVPAAEARRIRDQRRLRSLGIARARGPECPVEPVDVGEAGEPAVVEGVKGTWRVDPSQPGQPFSGRAALLSPFDRLIHDRRRAVELFGFDYQLEMYKPAAKRRWGYFALPILYDDRLVGKLDATADRDAGVLRVDAVHQDVPFDPTMTAAVEGEIKDLAHWLELDLTLPA